MAIAGAGSIAVVHALASSTAGFRVTAVASRGGRNARHLAGQLDARRVDVDRLPAGADLMVIATPPVTHEPLFEQALSAGAAVLVEKPLTTTLASADSMVRAAELPGAPATMVAENLLWSPYWLAALQHRRRTGVLGHLSAQVVQPPPNWGHFLEPLEAGGVLFDLGPHPVSLILAMADEPAVGVSARLSSSRGDGADDEAVLTVEFASGLAARVELSWVSPDTQWSIQAASPDKVVRLEFVPETLLEVDGEPVSVPHRHDVVDPRLETMGYVDQLRSMVGPRGEGSDRGGAPGSPEWSTPGAGQSIRDARDVLEVIFAAYASAGSGGRTVAVPFRGDRHRTPMQLWKADRIP